jgi:hypothetical protein
MKKLFIQFLNVLTRMMFLNNYLDSGRAEN